MALFGNSKTKKNKSHRDKDPKSTTATSPPRTQPTTQSQSQAQTQQPTNFYQQSNHTKGRLHSDRHNPRPTDASFYQHSNHTRTQSTPYREPPPPPPVYYDPRPHTSHGYQQQFYQPPPPQQFQPRIASPSHFPSPQPYHHASTSQQQLRPPKSNYGLGKLGASVNNLLLAEPIPSCVPGAKVLNDGLSPYQRHGTQYLNQGAALCDQIATKLNEVITSIDGDNFNGHESGLLIHNDQEQWDRQQQVAETSRGFGKGKAQPKGILNPPSTSINYFSKVNLYANSKLPSNLPPLKLYMPTYPLLCLAAQYSERVYTRPTGKERDTHVDADWKLGTKAMVLKSVPMDDMQTIVFAIRGSQTFMDWAVNLNSAPASAEGFLDDAGNFCHSGFLSVARRMVRPVAARLRALLEEDPNRSRYSLLITGHSAGGAVAALIYSHMLATSVQAASELNTLTGYFKRVHCVTFGAPPVSLLPLTKPKRPELHKSIFLSFVNEGDPVPRADVAYVRSLLDLYSSPAPTPIPTNTPSQSLVVRPSTQKLRNATSTLTLRKYRPTQQLAQATSSMPPIWPVPEAELSNAGRIVLLRSSETQDMGKRKASDRMNDGVVAQVISDDLLRGVIWGDPVCHMMRLYARRIEVLATNAVLGRT